MRHGLILALPMLALAACAPPPPVVEPIPVRSAIGQQNQFVPPPGGFAGASAAARSQAPMTTGAGGQTGFQTGGQAAGFVPLDGTDFDAGASASAASIAAARDLSGPNIVEYALGTTHRVGAQRYRRTNPLRWQTWERNCAAFPSQDAAQEAFLAAGGPDRDRRNLDPDGDGFACWWDPEPFRRAFRAGE